MHVQVWTHHFGVSVNGMLQVLQITLETFGSRAAYLHLLVKTKTKSIKVFRMNNSVDDVQMYLRPLLFPACWPDQDWLSSCM